MNGTGRPKDSVLRCLVHSTINKETGWHIVDAFERGDTYGLVLQWTALQGKEGEFPNRSIGVQKDCFEVVTDPASPYELRCIYSIDFDDLLSGERQELDANEIWRKPDNLFYPRPNEEDPP
jgi:hypothetical protein